MKLPDFNPFVGEPTVLFVAGTVLVYRLTAKLVDRLGTVRLRGAGGRG